MSTLGDQSLGAGLNTGSGDGGFGSACAAPASPSVAAAARLPAAHNDAVGTMQSTVKDEIIVNKSLASGTSVLMARLAGHRTMSRRVSASAPPNKLLHAVGACHRNRL